MKPIRTLTSWLGRPAVAPHRGLAVERLEDRLTPSVSDKLLALPLDVSHLSSTQDLIARTTSSSPITDLANVVDHLGLSSIVDLANSSLALSNGSSNLIQIHLRNGVSPANAAAALRGTGLYSFVTPNYIYPPGLSGRDLTEAVPNDPQYVSQYQDLIIDAPTAWDTSYGSSSVIVAILDDGIDLTHADLRENVWANTHEIAGDGIDNDGNGYIDDRSGWNFLGNNKLVTPDDPAIDKHGTEIAGVLAARIDNGLGLAGIAGRATIMPLKVIGNGSTTSLMLVKAIDYAVKNGARIINSSINIDPFINDPAFTAAVSAASDAGLLWVNSAGNLNLQDPARASLDDMLIVGATDRTDQKTTYSNYGWGLDVSAPGGTANDPLPTTIPGGYGTAFGTSLSAPLVAGTAALLWSANPTWTRDQVVSAILANADSLDGANPSFLDLLGTGRLNAGDSVSGGPFVTKLGRVYDLPGPGQDAPSGFESFRLRLQGNLDPSTVIDSNFELRWAGLDNKFDTADDHVVPLALSGDYQFGTNGLILNLGEGLDRGLYRFTAISGGLRDPFGTAVDGDNNGSAGGDLVRYFGNPLSAIGHITEDTDGDGQASPGDLPLPGAGAFPDFNNNGQPDQTPFMSNGIPVAIPDDANSSAVLDIPISGYTRPIAYLSVQVELSHSAPADLVITLISPNGTRVTLFRNRPVEGGPPAANQIFNFADEIVESTIITPNLITRNLKPDQPLSTLYGSDANGVWHIEVVDTTPGDSGTLLGGTITIGEEPIAFANQNGDVFFNDLPTDTIPIRVLPPSGYEAVGNIKNPVFSVDTRVSLPAEVAISLVRSTGISGRVLAGGKGLEATIFLDANGNGSLDAGETNTRSAADGRYHFEGLPAGTYAVRVTAKPGFTILNGTRIATITIATASNGNDFTLLKRTDPVAVAIPPITPNLRTSPVKAIDFTLSEPVENLKLADLHLSRDGVKISLAEATLIGGGTAFTLIGIEFKTGTDGNYTLTITAPAPAGEPSREPIPAVTTWTLDTTAPTGSLLVVGGAKGEVNSATLQFNSPVNGLDLTDFTLRRGGVSIPLTGVQLNATGLPNVFTLSNLTAAANLPGLYTLELKSGSVADSAGNALAVPLIASWTVAARPVHLTVVGTGPGTAAAVNVYDSDGGLVRTLTPFELTFTGGVRVAAADVNGDLTDDIIVGAGVGAGPRVIVYDGKTGLVLSDFFAFEGSFRGGVLVSAGDLNGDGKAEIVLSPDNGGGPRIRIVDGLTNRTLNDFYGLEDPDFRGGARTALGDVNGDGVLDLIVSAGTGGGPRVLVYDGKGLTTTPPGKPIRDFFAFEGTLRNGAYVAAADLDGDGLAEIIVGAGEGGGPRVSAFSAGKLLQGQYQRISDFYVGDLTSRGGLRLAVKDLDDDGIQELLVGTGPGTPSRVNAYTAVALLTPKPAILNEFDPFDGFLGGIFLG